MAVHFTSQFGWSSADSGIMIGIIAGPQGCTIERLEMSLQPGTAPTYWRAELERGGTAGTSSGTVATCPVRDNVSAATKILFEPGSIASDPYLPGTSNTTLCYWTLNDGNNPYVTDIPGGGMWVPPGGGAYLDVGAGADYGGNFFYTLYFREE